MDCWFCFLFLEDLGDCCRWNWRWYRWSCLFVCFWWLLGCLGSCWCWFGWWWWGFLWSVVWSLEWFGEVYSLCFLWFCGSFLDCGCCFWWSGSGFIVVWWLGFEFYLGCVDSWWWSCLGLLFFGLVLVGFLVGWSWWSWLCWWLVRFWGWFGGWFLFCCSGLFIFSLLVVVSICGYGLFL